ncbi:MAG: class I tRNA ligase family protein [Elusimicrobiales bacterium]|nr:class I tRNA ligase family protein [Elusimicrobiales bacterium]
MLQLSVKCPHCGKTLMDAGRKMDGRPAIKICLSYAGKKGMLYLSSIYGSYSTGLPFTVPPGKVAGFRCPHCDADLKSTRKCDVCGAQMVAFELKHGGHVQICSRKDCKKHVLEFQDPKSELEAFYKSYAKSFA